MKSKEILFSIDENGEITSTVKGIKGSTCQDIAKAFETIGKVTRQERTHEYYEKETSVISHIRGTNRLSD